MRHILAVLAACLAALLPAHALAGAGELEIEQQVAEATMNWVEAYNSRDPARIAALYAPDALFWGTRSTRIANQPEQILTYFQESARNPNLRVRIDDRRIRVYHQVAVCAGTYTVTDVKDGQEVANPGRFTFVFEKRGERWLIVHHHSSRMPAP
jgi:uncharacterized protein (TIGR02246 family)